MVAKTTKLKNLNTNPLSIAKYFYEKGVETSLVIQQLIYFTYLEALKDRYLIFKEEWKAWPNGPVIELVIDKMFDNYDKLDKLFAKIEDLENELVLNYADKVFKKYRNKERYIIFEKAQNKPWKDARKPLKSEKEVANIPFSSLVNFTNGKQTRITA